MKGAVVGSSLIHATLVAVILLLRPPIARIVPGPDAVQVALVDPGMLVAPAPAPAVTPPPAEAPPEPEAVRIEKPKKAPERRAVEPVPPPPAPRETPPAEKAPPALPMAAIGAGLRGEMAVDGPNFEFSYYLQLVRSRVGQSWTPPAGLASGGAPIRAVVYFRIGRDGHVLGTRLESASGVEFFDRSALRAIVLSDPMPPLPLGYGAGELGVHFGFEYVAP